MIKGPFINYGPGAEILEGALFCQVSNGGVHIFGKSQAVLRLFCAAFRALIPGCSALKKCYG